MRVHISVDMEGIAGIVDWSQARIGNPGYEQGCRHGNQRKDYFTHTVLRLVK